MVAEDTAKITDRRQTVNTLFVTINALFLTGVGYLFYQFFQNNSGDVLSLLFVPGFLAIAIITSLLNRAWLRLSEQSRKLVNLRIRYLETLESFLRETGDFPVVDTRLRGADKTKQVEYEMPPDTFPGAEVTHPDAAGVQQRWMRTRGTYSLEEVLYNNPHSKKEPFGFSQAEQLVGRTFNWAYWLGFVFSILAVIIQLVFYFANIHAKIGPYSF